MTPPILIVTPLTLDLSLLQPGATTQSALILSNAGGTTLTGTASISPGPFTILSGTPFSLAASANTNLELSFSPVTERVFTNFVAFSSNAGDSTNLIIGRALNPPNFTFSFSTVSGFTYDAQFKDSLDVLPWQTFATIPGNGSLAIVTNSPSSSNRFFRARVQ